MKSFSTALVKSLAVRSAVAAAAIAACSGASALTLSPFTFNPGVLGVSSPSFTADTLTVNDFAKVVGGAASFTETGLLDVSAFNLNGTRVSPVGYGSSYNLYVSFDAAGTAGALTQLDYRVYGYTGSAATFSVSDAAGATTTATGATLLATGSLLPGNNTFSGGVGGATLTANALSFANVTGFSGASGAVASFINSSNQLTATSTGFLVNAGGGTINLISAVPEPETYALLLGGLAAVGFVARRRNNG